MKLHISVEPKRKNSNFKVHVAGSLDDDGARVLQNTCRELLEKEKNPKIEIDLADVSYISESGARFLCFLKSNHQINLVEPRFLTLAMIKSIEKS